MTQHQLAERVGVKSMTISRLERSDPRVQWETRELVARELGLIFDWIDGSFAPSRDISEEMIQAMMRGGSNRLRDPSDGDGITHLGPVKRE